jgi:hypothetical protein
MRTAVLAFVVALLAAAGFARPAAAQGIHGALAISTSTGAYGFGYNYDTPAQAQARAMTECAKHARDCKVFVNLQRACIAIARGQNNAFGWAIGFPNDERPERALNECAAQSGTTCEVVTSFCTGMP